MEEKKEDSTTKIYKVLKGGPPAKPPVLGRKKIYGSAEVIKIDEDGEPYIGMSIKELTKISIENTKDNDRSLSEIKSSISFQKPPCSAQPNGSVIITLNDNAPKLTHKNETVANDTPQELSEEEIIKIMKERFSGRARNYSGPMKFIPEHSILNAPVMADKEDNCVVQKSSNSLIP